MRKYIDIIEQSLDLDENIIDKMIDAAKEIEGHAIEGTLEQQPDFGDDDLDMEDLLGF